MKIVASIAHAAHIPERQQSLQRMLDTVESAFPTTVVGDRGPPHVWSRKQWLAVANSTDATHGLFLNDDLLLCDHFQETVTSVVGAQPNEVISLYCSDPKTQHIVGRWYTSRDGLIGNAYIVPVDILRDFLRFRENALQPTAKFKLSEDQQLNLFCMATGRKIWHTRPSLVEHDVSIASCFGNEKNLARTSVVGPWLNMHELNWTVRKPPHFGRFFNGNYWGLLKWIRPEYWEEYDCFNKMYEYSRDHVANVRLSLTSTHGNVCAEWCDPVELPDNDYQKQLCLERYEWASSRVRKGSIVANAACGSNFGTPMILVAGAHRCVGVDSGEEQKRINDEKQYGEFYRGDIEALQFHGFDTVVSVETLEHLREPFEWLSRLSHDVKDLILTTPIVPTKHVNKHHLHDFTEEQLTSWLNNNGWSIVDKQYQDDPGWMGGTKNMVIMLHAVRNV